MTTTVKSYELKV